MRIAILAVALMAGCAQTNYQQFEGRGGPQIFEGQGGTKEVVDGYDIWDNGTPPRRYQLLGVVVVEDFDNVFGRQRIRSALAAQIRAAGGDAAIVAGATGGGQAMGFAFDGRGGFAPMMAFGKKEARWQIIKYVDQK